MMRQIETDPTIIDDDNTDVMIPIAPVTDAMSDLLNRYVYDILDTFEAMVIKRVTSVLLGLVGTAVVCLVLGALTKEWTPLFVAVICLFVYGIGTYPILEVVRKRPDPATISHVRVPKDKTSIN